MQIWEMGWLINISHCRGFKGKSTGHILTPCIYFSSKKGKINCSFTFYVSRPLTVHCSPGTGRTGTIIACDIAIRALEQPTRSVDIPQIVYVVRRGRASAVQTREQYEFIYKVCIHRFASLKLKTKVITCSQSQIIFAY